MSASGFQFFLSDVGDVPNADSTDQRRLFLDRADLFWKFKDQAGAVTLAAAVSLPFIHNAVVNFAASPYSAIVQETVKCDPTAGEISVVLPDPAGFSAGSKIQVVIVIDGGPPPNNVVVTALAGALINGQASFTLNTFRESLVVESDGTNYIIT